jgi:ATPase family associated with various cellular activities (AAA)
MSEVIFNEFPDTTELFEDFVFTPWQHYGGDELWNIPELCFLELYYRGYFRFVISYHFAQREEKPLSIPKIQKLMPEATVHTIRLSQSIRDIRHISALIKVGEVTAFVASASSNLKLRLGSNDKGAALEMGRRIYEACHFDLQVEDETVLHVRTRNSSGDDLERFSNVEWRDVRNNYPSTIQKSLDALMEISEIPPPGAGRVIVFHGEPGTGKTWALRSLLTQWRTWCEGALIVDAEELVDNTSYLMNLLQSGDEEKTQLLILEDADEIVARRHNRSQGVVRLLNAADGIIGSNRNVMMLFTTNAPPDQLDAALVRPGRCLATIEFGPFGIAEATARLGEYGPASGPMTLAEIYNKMARDGKIVSGEVSRPLGQYL